MYFQPLSTYPPHGVNRQMPLPPIQEVQEPAAPVETQVLPLRVFARRDCFEAPDAGIDRALCAEVDRLLTRFPHEDPVRLRDRFLGRLEHRLEQVAARLALPEVAAALDVELGQAQGEIEALLPADPPATDPDAPPLSAAGQGVFDHLRTSFPQAGCPDALLRRVSTSLVARGIDSPAAVDRMLGDAWRHDLGLETGTAALGQLGYGAGFQLFSMLLAPALAPRLLGRGFLPAFGFGYAAGALVGLCDALATAGLQNVADGLRHAPAASAVAGRLAKTATISAGTTFLKNYLLRVLLPTLVIHAGWPEGIARSTRNRVDFLLDAGGCPLAGAMAAWLRCTVLDDPQAHGRRLISTADLDSLIDRMQRPMAAGDMAQALRLFAEGLGKAALAPSTWAVVALVVAPMIGLLLSAQNAVPQAAFMVVQGAVAATGAAVTDGPLLRGAVEPPVRASEHAVRAAISTTMMALMAGAATAAGGTIGPRTDAAAFRSCVSACRRVVRALRHPPEQASEPVTLRRRSVNSA